MASEVAELTVDDVAHIAALARLNLTAAEAEAFRGELNSALAMAQALDKVDTADLPETAQVTGLTNVVREDETTTPMALEDALANAPASDDKHFLVPTVL